jgi:small subunit ribosomal protein S5
MVELKHLQKLPARVVCSSNFIEDAVSKVRLSELDLKDKLVYVGRTAKVVKGGRRFNFTALVVVGDGNGHIGYGLGKAGEVVDAVSKATEAAKKSVVKIQLQNTTIPHEVLAKYGAASVLIKPATPGTGVIAGGGVRAVLELAGVQDVLTKSMGSSNPHNTVKATIRALTLLEDAQSAAQRRGISLKKVLHG